MKKHLRKKFYYRKTRTYIIIFFLYGEKILAAFAHTTWLFL